MRNYQETGQTTGMDEATRRGNGTGEPTSVLSQGQHEAYQGFTQQEIDDFLACAKPVQPRVRVKGGIVSLVPKLLRMNFTPTDALNYASQITGEKEAVEPLIKAATNASLGQQETFDFTRGWRLQPEAVINEDRPRRG